MTHLKLVADEPTPLERLLLDASRSEQPSEEHRAKLRTALGIGLSGTAAPSTGSAGGEGSAVGPTAAGSSKLAAIAKLAAAAAAAAACALSVFALSRPLPKPAIKLGASVPPHAQVTSPAPALTQAPSVPPISPLPPPEASDAKPSSGSSSSQSPRMAASTTENLSEQIRLIETARAGVAAHDAKAALDALDGYAARFPRGSFGQEATVLRIRALEQAGDLARAGAMAKAFITRFPESPHVARLKPIAERASLK